MTQVGPLLLAQLDVAHDLVELGLVDLRALLGGRDRTDRRPARPCSFGDQPLDELVVDRVLDEQPRLPAQQHWPWLKMQADVGPGGGGVQVGVGEDDVGALAAELEGQPLQRVGAPAA